MSEPLKIGVRDSGVGGLTVARCILQLLPDATLLYFADTAHVPYGERTPAEVRHYALSITNFLIERGAAMVVFACNTSSAYGLPAARERFSVPLFGMNEPGARAALECAEPNETIGVLATQATVDSGIYCSWLESLRPGAKCLEVACPRFVPLVEDEKTESRAARRAVAEKVAVLRGAQIRTVILGCTHYPLLLPILAELAPEMNFIDPAQAVAQAVADQAAQREYSAPVKSQFYVSGASSSVRHWAKKLLPDENIGFQRGPVFDLPLADSGEYSRAPQVPVLSPF